eukprot:2877-Heterococcus_DN1.PRE.4
MESSADVAHFESLVAQLTDGNSCSEDCIDYVDWSNRIDIADLQRISRGCREVGPFARAALDDDGLQLLGNMRRRIGDLTAAAEACGVRLMIDAEQTTVQPAIDSLIQALQRKYNRVNAPTIYATYQVSSSAQYTLSSVNRCYLKDTPKRVAYDLERAKRGGYTFACKLNTGSCSGRIHSTNACIVLQRSDYPVFDVISNVSVVKVRGAYMTAERQRALETGTPSPVCDTIEQTHANYSHCVDLVLQSIAAGSAQQQQQQQQQQQHLQQQQQQQQQRAAAEVMVATHNQASVEHTLRRMRELQLVSNNNSTKSDAPKQSDVSSNVSSSGVSFGQLLGMSDHLTFPLGAHGYSVYKYLPYGKVSEVMPYLLRRAQENSSLLGVAVHERQLLAQEVKRRLLRR